MSISPLFIFLCVLLPTCHEEDQSTSQAELDEGLIKIQVTGASEHEASERSKVLASSDRDGWLKSESERVGIMADYLKAEQSAHEEVCEFFEKALSNTESFSSMPILSSSDLVVFEEGYPLSHLQERRDDLSISLHMAVRLHGEERALFLVDKGDHPAITAHLDLLKKERKLQDPERITEAEAQLRIVVRSAIDSLEAKRKILGSELNQARIVLRQKQREGGKLELLTKMYASAKQRLDLKKEEIEQL